MKVNIRVYLYLLIIYISLAFLGFIATKILETGISFLDISFLLTGSLFISFIATFIFFYGEEKGNGKNVFATLIAIVVKFILFLVLIVIYKLFRIDLSIPFLISFFIIYLSFTSYLLITFVSILKTKNEFKADVSEK